MAKSVAKKRKLGHTPMLMFKYEREFEPLIIKILIEDMSPSKALEMAPGLPADILFLCLRYAIYTRDEEKAKSLLSNTVEAIQRLIDQRPKDPYVLALWLANTCQMVNNCKSFSEADPNASIYFQELENTANSICQKIIANIKEKVEEYVRNLMLTGNCFTNDLNCMLSEFLNWKTVLLSHNVHSELVSKIFQKVFYFLCTEAINFTTNSDQEISRPFRQNFLSFSEHILTWCAQYEMGTDVIQTLQPLAQAANLQHFAEFCLRDKEDSITIFSENCDKLSAIQVLALLANGHYSSDVNIKYISCSNIVKVINLKRKSEIPCLGNNLCTCTCRNFVDLPICSYSGHLEQTEIPNLLYELGSILQIYHSSPFT